VNKSLFQEIFSHIWAWKLSVLIPYDLRFTLLFVTRCPRMDFERTEGLKSKTNL